MNNQTTQTKKDSRMPSPMVLFNARNLKAKKNLGQNFLADPSTAAMIVARSQLAEDDVVLEIGAGLGALTIPAGRFVRRVYAVEKDGVLYEILASWIASQGIENIEVIQSDIFDIDVPSIAAAEHRKLIVMGNLPYNISSPTLFYLMRVRRHIHRAILMFQKEVTQRLIAVPGTKEYGRLSVMLQYAAEIRPLASVAAHLFTPRPKVDSMVVEIRFRECIDDPVADENRFSGIVKAAFGKRRKMLKNTLSDSELDIGPQEAERILTKAGIDPSRRAETLSVSEFVALDRAFAIESVG
jgi:16S rRNA (adenine1518-N6/adenine1519-N6)-dimethyltransferase